MKVLFFPIYMITPHFETELELMKEHLLKGHEVYVIHCRGELSSCFYNPGHFKYRCILCKSTFKQGIIQLNSDKLHVINIPFPQTHYDEIPSSFNTVEEIKDFKIGNIEVGMSSASSLISAINKDHRFDTIRYKESVLKEINNAYYVYDFFKNILIKVKPDIVYLFNGRFSTALPAINACEELGIPYFTHERGGSLNKYFLAKNTLPHDTSYTFKDMIKLWEDSDKALGAKIGEKFFTDRRGGVIHHWYSLTDQQRQNLLPENFDRKKKNIVFFNSTIEEFAAVRCRSNPIPIYGEEITAFRQILKDFELDDNFHFYIRMHPNLRGYINTQVLEAKALEKEFSNITVISPESSVDSYALMDNCDKCIAFLSTMGIEACYWGKPCILLGHSQYEKFDCCYVPKNHEETIELIKAELPPKDKSGAIVYGFWMINNGLHFKYFNQTSVTTGTFENKRISYTKLAFIRAALSYPLSIKSISDITRLFKIGINLIFNRN